MPKYKLVCFDVDGTLVDNITFSWQLFHDYFQTDRHKREDAKNALELLEKQGGSLEPENYILYDDNRVDYLCYINAY